MSLISYIDLFAFMCISVFVGYELFFTIASFINKYKIKQNDYKLQSFVIIFAAYKEDRVIKESIENILNQDYPKDKYQIVVVSDHMQNTTNQVLARFPINLLIPNFKESMKHKSLTYALDHLDSFDRAIIMDADNVVDNDFLTRINKATQTGIALQTHRTRKNENTPVAIWDGISEEINNTIFRKGHVNVGLSSALIGSGMVFDFEWLKLNMPKCNTFAEDKELEAILASENIFIDYSDNIYVYDEKTAKQDILIRQRSRWFHAQILAFRLILKHFHFGEINLTYLDKIFQWIPFPRSFRIICILGASILGCIIDFSIAIKWGILLSITTLTLLLAIPRKMYTRSLFTSILQLPPLFFLLIKSYISSLQRIKNKDMRFNNTPHDITQRSNKTH